MKEQNLGSNKQDQPFVDYGFEQGLNFQDTIYKAGNSESYDERNISLEDIQPKSLPSLEQVKQNLDFFRIYVGKVAIELAYIKSATTPSNKNSNNLNILVPPWQGNWHKPLAQNELRYIIANQPDDTDMLLINHAVQGDSDRMPKEISKQVAQSGHFGPIGEIYGEAINPIIANDRYDKINIAGQSYGGRVAAATAPYLQYKPENLIIVDSPGSRDQGGLFGMSKATAGEARNKTGYDAHNHDKANNEIQIEFDQPLVIAKRLWDVKMKGGLKQQLIEQPQAMSRQSLEYDLSQVAPNIAELIRFVSPALSEHNYPDDVAMILQRVSEVNELLTVSHEIIPYHSHSMTSGNPDVYAYMLYPNSSR